MGDQKRLYHVHDDFEAVIRIFSTVEGGRKNPAFNGIRWDFQYTDDLINGYVIWPDFYDENGDSLPTDEPLTVGPELKARMTIFNDEIRLNIHRRNIAEGIRFYCIEGGTSVAEGKVTRITGLFNDR